MFSRSVTVITAATGHANLAKCLKSVQAQTYPDVEHFVVTDGVEHQSKVAGVIAGLAASAKKIHTMTLPYPTGKNRWCGHRIYAAASFLVNSQYLCYLDEDNWFEPAHIESLVLGIHADAAQWAYSLRKLVDINGNFVALDECESLGHLHAVFDAPKENLIDTSCYLLPREIAVEIAPIWYGPTARGAEGIEPDREVCMHLLKHRPRVYCSRQHTMNYTLGQGPLNVQSSYFLKGNQQMRERYPQGLPWERAPRRPRV
jgi:hypothetical protein